MNQRYPVPQSSEITPKSQYLERRRFIQQLGLMGLSGLGIKALSMDARAETTHTRMQLNASKSAYQLEEKPTPYADVTGYNNFYEWGTDKTDPARYAESFKTRPWSLSVEGLVGKPARFEIDDLLKRFPLEDRIYRLRCVEAWSMVIPWVGFPLAALLKQVDPLGSAKFVEFKTLLDPSQMPGQRREVLDWPYIEGLRLDEAMHPLTLLAVGLYGEVLPNQNGAPIRLVVPWKYGFKSIKSIVSIRLTEKAPITSWMKAGPSEYGFFANVNPDVDHPRWSQAKERPIGSFFKKPTLLFNGYANEVASMYSGLDLKTYF